MSMHQFVKLFCLNYQAYSPTLLVGKLSKLFYYCAIPRKVVIPEGFISKEISSNKCLVVEHIGVMDRIYETYSKIYKEILPNAEYIPLQENFLHFERYDTRFHWKRDSSVIEIWIPIK